MKMFHVLGGGHALLGAAAAMLGLLLLGGGCDSSQSNATGTPNSRCVTGELRCACYANKTCNNGLACLSDVCVEATSSGTGGTTSVGAGGTTAVTEQGGATTEQGGATTTSQGGATTTSQGGATTTSQGGVTTTSQGGVTTTSQGGATTSQGGTTVGDGGTLVTAGGATVVATGGATVVATGGATVVATGGATTVATGGAATVGTGGAATVVSTVIDGFSTCDANIDSVSGRSGKWYSFADTDLNLTLGYGDPGTTWVDHTCAAYALGGCTGGTACTYGGIGLQLFGGAVYDLYAYSGVRVTIESGDDVYFILKTCNPATCTGTTGVGYHGAWMLGGVGSVLRTVSFASLMETLSNQAGTYADPRYATEMQFTIGKTLTGTTGFGFAIHKVELY